MKLRGLKRSVRALASQAGFQIFKTASLPCCTDLVIDLDRLGVDLNDRVIVDVGANEGQTTDYFQKPYPRSQIVCIEPFPASFEICRRRFASNSKISCLQLALGAAPGQQSLYLAAESQLHSLKPETAAANGHSIQVAVDTLDNVCERLGLGKIDFLKIDTEGADLDVLRGGSRVMSKNGIGFIFAECGFDLSDQRHTSFFDLYSYLHERGFNFLGLYNVHQSNGRLYFCDALFMSSRYSHNWKRGFSPG